MFKAQHVFLYDFVKWSGWNIILPVSYLGLPLMTRVMRKQDYLPLVERVRSKINNAKFLSYAGWLQLFKAGLMSIVNFLAIMFRLTSKCIKEVEHLCASFLWSGPELKSTGAKIAWRDICKLKNEGLGIKLSKKLIWSMD